MKEIRSRRETPTEGEHRADGTPRPTVSIGLPVYNGGETLARALAAIQAQSFEDFELIISDNASTDNTLEICDAAASADRRIRIIRQAVNRGPILNFHKVLEEASAEFFAFAAADDEMLPNFLAETLSALRSRPDAVCCTARTTIRRGERTTRNAFGARPIQGPNWWRPAWYLVRPADNSRFYGLYRTSVLRGAYIANCSFHAFDWLVSALTLSEGEHLASENIVLHRVGGELGRYYRQHTHSKVSPIDRIFPVGRMSSCLIQRLKPSQLPLVIPVLVWLNLQKSLEHAAFALIGTDRRQPVLTRGRGEG